MKEKDRILGIIFGTAIGDALGAPVEFLDLQGIKNKYGKIEDLIDGKYTDDTQMFRAVMLGLFEAASWQNVNDAGKAIARQFVIWLNSTENNRAPGKSCLAGCRNLEQGAFWRESGVTSDGCGAAMRSMAYGIWFDSINKAMEWATEHARLTHTNSRAIASAGAVAGIVAALKAGACPVDAVTMGIDGARQYEGDTAIMLKDALEWARKVKPEEKELQLELALNRYRGWTGNEAVAASIFCFLLYPDSYKDAVLAAVNSPGDSDTLGAITGAFSGAHLGIEAIPENWIERIERRDTFYWLAERYLELRKFHSVK